MPTSHLDMRDSVVATAQRERVLLDRERVVGRGWYKLHGPTGLLLATGLLVNKITDVGDEFYAKKGVGAAANVPTGMRLGTGTTAESKNGAGAAIVTYVAGSHKAFEGTFPSAASKGAGLGWRITYKTIWGAGVATANGIAETVITNETPLTDVAGTAANTLSRSLLSPTVNKGALDQLTIEWYHDFLG